MNRRRRVRTYPFSSAAANIWMSEGTPQRARSHWRFLDISLTPADNYRIQAHPRRSPSHRENARAERNARNYANRYSRCETGRILLRVATKSAPSLTAYLCVISWNIMSNGLRGEFKRRREFFEIKSKDKTVSFWDKRDNTEFLWSLNL